MRNYSSCNTYNLQGTRLGQHPKYLKIIEYLYKSDKTYFSRKDLLVESGYMSLTHFESRSRGCMSALLTSLSQEDIIHYDSSKRVWKLGDNFYKWINCYYSELSAKDNIFKSLEDTKKKVHLYAVKCNSFKSMSEIDKMFDQFKEVLSNKLQ